MMATTTEIEADKKVEDILRRARKESAKGRYYVYEMYKSELAEVCESSVQYDRAIFQLTKILRV